VMMRPLLATLPVLAIVLCVPGCGGEEPQETSAAGHVDVAPAAPAPAAQSGQEQAAPTPQERAEEPVVEAASARAPDRSQHDAAAPVTRPEAAAEPAADGPQAGPRPGESVQECLVRVLQQVRQAYARLDIAEVIMHEQTILAGKEMPPVRHLARFASRQAAYIEDQHSRLTIYDGTMFYSHNNRPEDFARVPYAGDLSDAVGAFRSASILPIALYAGRDLDFIMPMFRFGGSAVLRPESCRAVTDHNGHLVTRLHLTGSEADTTIDVDPASGHIIRINASFILPDDIVLAYERRFEFEVRRYEELPEEISFDTTGMQEWPTVQMVVQRSARPAAPITGPMEPMEPGEVAPSFELRTIYGRRFQYESDDQHYTILAFWAARHSEARRFLAEMEALQRWFNDGPVEGRVIAVNSLDGRAILERFDATFDFWEQRDWGMTSLFDENDDVARRYRISPIPAAVLIAPDGEVLGVWNGQSRGYQMLVRDLVTTHANRDGDDDASDDEMDP